MVMVRNEFDEVIELLTVEMLNPKMQTEMRQVITQTPEIYREMVENQELGFAGIRKTLEGHVKTNGAKATEVDIQKVMKTVDKRMLTESPSLIEHKLKYIAGNLVPDKIAHKKYAQDNPPKVK